MPEKILVVDDEESIRFTFDIFLSEEGYDVTTAESYDDAMSHLLATDFDLIFLDIIMEGRSGIDLLPELNKQGANIPVIIITGAPSIDTATEALRQGALDYIIKPVNQDNLLRTVRMALKHKSLIDEKEKCRLNSESIFRSVKEGIITIDRNMSVLQVNESAMRICDLQPDAVLGKNFRLIANSCQGKCIASLQNSFDTNKNIKTSYIECGSVKNPDQVVTVTTTPLMDSAQKFAGVVMFVHDETEYVMLKRSLDSNLDDSRFVGKSRTMQAVRAMIQNLADVQTTVLVTGESGTGKELVVESLHQSSDRSDRPLVKVNCAALSEELLGSELFGHVKGAFTGAIKDKTGRFQLADEGTLFLDEIGDISLKMQSRLLRVIETMEFERVGDSTPITVDVRIVTATNKNLKELVAEGSFREDLYYRLKVIEITLPPLQRRQDDIPLLINHFLSKYNRKFNKEIKGISSDTLAKFMGYIWPGNIREMENIIEHAFVCCHDDLITTAHLPADFNKPSQDDSRPEPMDEGRESEAIQEALEKTLWNKSKAADLLGISRRTMYRKMKKHGIPFADS